MPATAALANWQIEFPDFTAADMPRIPEGFEDVSWHNDSCPSFLNERAGLMIFVERIAPEDREDEGTPRFGLAEWKEGATGTYYAQGEVWADILKAIAGRLYPNVMLSLHHEFMAYTMARGLDGGDAIELLMTDLPKPPERQWIADFIERWDAADEARRWGV